MLRQIAAVTLLNLKSLPNRVWPSLVIVVGMACVIGVLISMLSLTTGYVESEMRAGDPGRAIIIADGQENESASALTLMARAAITRALVQVEGKREVLPNAGRSFSRVKRRAAQAAA